MKALLLLLLFSPLLLAESYKFIAGYSDDVYDPESKQVPGTANRAFTYLAYVWDITEDLDTGTKFFSLDAQKCTRVEQSSTLSLSPIGPPTLVWPPPKIDCVRLTYANAITLTEIQAALSFFYNLAPGKVAHIIQYYQGPPTHLPLAIVQNSLDEVTPSVVRLPHLSTAPLAAPRRPPTDLPG